MAPRSLVLITIDCLRADHTGFLGYSGGTTPFLDSVAREAFVFENALASGVPTYYSLPALLVSRHPLGLGRDVVGIAPGENTIAGVLKDSGFHTAAFIAGNPYITAACGYSTGFDIFANFLDSEWPDRREDTAHQDGGLRATANRIVSRACHSLPGFAAAYDELYFQYCQKASRADHESFDGLRQFPSADVLVDSAIGWVNENHYDPFFLWLHFMDPHAPYYPKQEALYELERDISATEAKYLNCYWARSDMEAGRLQNKRSKIVSLYDAGIRWADLQISRLVNRLRELNVWEQCAMAVTADHGEEFLDHGGRFHPPVALNEELIRVPLILRVPGLSQCRTLNDPLGLIDLAPTLLDAIAVPTPAAFRGRSCWPKLLKNERWNRPVFTECVHGCRNPMQATTRLGPRLLSVRKEQHKLVVNFASGTEQLFELNSDPHELRPVPGGSRTELRTEMLQYISNHLTESRRSHDFDLRLAAQTREIRLDWTHAGISRPN